MMQTQLDDRHDILGNTIYRLSFDSTIIAGSREGELAGITVTLGHYHDRKIGPNGKIDQRILMMKQRYEEDYKQLYADWLRRMQRVVVESIENINNSIMRGKPESRVRLLFAPLLIGRICEFMLNDRRLGDNIDKACSPEHPSNKVAGDIDAASNNKKVALKLLDSYIIGYFNSIEHVYFALFQQSIQAVARLDAGRLQSAYGSARQQCRDQGLTSIDSGFVLQSIGDNKSPSIGTRSKQITCPFYDSPGQRLIAGIMLYDELLNFVPKPGAVLDIGDPEGIRKQLGAQREESCRARRLTSDSLLCGLPNQRVAFRCFAADFIKSVLNAFERPRADDYERINDFLSLDIVGREAGDCHLLVSPRPTDKAGQENPISVLKLRLNESTEAFSYSIAPKNLSENISNSAEIRDAFEMLARHEFGVAGKDSELFADALRKRSSQIQAILAHPIVVGFGSSIGRGIDVVRNSENEAVSTAAGRPMAFGWVVAPRIREDREFAQVDGQYSLTAVISVPSWWRSVELDIETCWMSRAQVDGFLQSRSRGADHIAGTRVRERGKRNPDCDSSESQWMVIRLPGPIQELSRKLGFEVLQEPHLSADQTEQNLDIGQKGVLLLRGERLWRSTEVTLGSQLANSIVVLPNMEGIIATFNCVRPQSGEMRNEPDVESGQTVRISRVPARVWTSEGVTEIANIDLRWPRKTKAATAANSDRAPTKPGAAGEETRADVPGNGAAKAQLSDLCGRDGNLTNYP